MKNSEIHTELVRWMAGLTGLIVIKGEQSGDRPALPYVQCSFLGLNEVREWPMQVEFTGDVDVTATPVIETEWHFSVHAFGDSPTDVLRPLRSAAMLGEVSEPLAKKGLTVHQLSQIRNIPEYIQETWEPRAQMDIFMRGLTRDGFLVNVIEQYSFNFERA